MLPVFPPGKLLNVSERIIFWDFDGVIKDSVDIKTHAFVQLFQPYGPYVAERVLKHHEANGGMSRFDKLPLYLRWAGEEPTEDRVKELCEKFSKAVLQSVIDAPWVPGAQEYIRTNPHLQIFVLVSATPQEEIEKIIQALGLAGSFAAVFGAPTSKKEAIRLTLSRYKIPPHQCLMIGDAIADWDAAMANEVPFLLRRHGTNEKVFENYTGNSVEDFTAL
ncbi:MAG: HAD family hydrolase [Deltaproteobacteria bacterium HGW-Deltaproteobacteria-12]|nr:MAG: HAD family hydrolase [Deltaproteobacteria bacterium HGW-Deltaproteobacteria-12]